MTKETLEYFKKHPELWEEICKAALIKYCEMELAELEEKEDVPLVQAVELSGKIGRLKCIRNV